MTVKTFEEAKENTYLRKFLYVFIMFQRTVLIYPTTILLLSAIQAVIDLRKSGDSNEYAMIFVIMFGGILNFFSYFISFMLV